MSMNNNSEVFQYIVQPEDTIWDLAEVFNTSEEDILTANPGLDPYNLNISQVINIPGDAVTAEQYWRYRGYRRPYFYRPYRYPYRPYYRPYYRPPYYPY